MQTMMLVYSMSISCGCDNFAVNYHFCQIPPMLSALCFQIPSSASLRQYSFLVAADYFDYNLFTNLKQSLNVIFSAPAIKQCSHWLLSQTDIQTYYNCDLNVT